MYDVSTTDLQQHFYRCIKENDLFLQLIHEQAVEGYLFFTKDDVNNCLLDASFASHFSHRGAVVLNIKKTNNFYNEFLEYLITSVSSKESSANSENEITEISIGDKLYNTYLSYTSYVDASNGQKYFLIAIKSSQFLKKDNPLDIFSEVLEFASWQCNIQTGELYINEKWAEVLGYTSQQLEPVTFDTFAQLTHPDDLNYVNKILEQYSVGAIKEYKCEVRMRHKNGHWVWLLSRGKTISKSADGKVEWMMGSHIDITERKIREEEADFLALVPINTFNSIVITDEKGRINFVNDAFQNLTGYSSSEVIGKQPGDFLRGPNTDPEDIADFTQKLKTGKSFRQQILNYTKAGEEYIVSCHIDPVYDEKGNISRYISIQQDITQEVKDHEYLATFKTTLDQTDDCIFIFDGESLQFSYVNKGAIHMMGYNEEMLLRLHPYDIKPEYPEDKFRELVRPLKDGRVKNKRFRTVHLLKNGEKLPVEVSLQYISAEESNGQFVAIVRDISEDIAKEEELKRLSLVAENTNNLVVITDAIGHIEYVNASFERRTGYLLAELKGEKPGNYLHGPETNPMDIKENREGLKKMKPFTQEILNYTKSGETYWVSITFNPVFDESRNLINYIAIETDITERKAQEEKIKESEERLQSVLKGSELGYWDLDFAKDESKMNDRWYEMLGYSENDFDNSIDYYQNLIHPEDKGQLTHLMENSFVPNGKDDFSVEVRVRHKLGHYVWILDRGAVVKRDKKGAPLRISGTHMEITERKHLEAQLEEERYFLKQILDGNGMLILVLNQVGKIVYANRGAELILGLERAKIENKPYNDRSWIPVDLNNRELNDDEIPFKIIKSSAETLRDYQMGIKRKDGSIRYITVSGSLLNYKENRKEVVLSAIDITDRIEAEKELNETRNHTDNILKNISDVVWSVTLPDFNLRFITPSIEKITGYPDTYYKEKYIGKKWEISVFKEDAAILDKIYQDIEETGSFEAEYRILTKDNQVKWVQNKGNYIYENGEAKRMDGFIAEITDRKNKEFELNKYLKIVEDQNDRLKNFTYIVSHNLRSHSANIQGLMHLINTKNKELAENRYVQMLDTASNKLDDTLHHLNNVVSVISSQDEMKKLNLKKAIHDFTDTFANLIEDSGIDFSTNISETVHVEAVPAFLESIITNLLTNAIKYRDPKKAKSCVKIGSRNMNGIVIIVIEDNGLGIDLKRYGDKLFGMYKTFHTHKNSRGLGLFLTKNQVESMGGRIEVESEINVGSKFKVFLKDGSI